jgi:hypothetical protein
MKVVIYFWLICFRFQVLIVVNPCIMTGIKTCPNPSQWKTSVRSRRTGQRNYWAKRNATKSTIKNELVKGYPFLISLFFCFTGVKGAKVLPPVVIDGGECSSTYMDPLGSSVVLQSNVVGVQTTKWPSHSHFHTVNRRQQHDGMIIVLLALSVAAASHAALRGSRKPFSLEWRKKQLVNL